MTIKTHDIGGWAKRNIWRRPTGELCVRPGLRKVLSPDANTHFCGGFSVLNAYANEVWHYLFYKKETSPFNVVLRIVDEDFATFHELSLGVIVEPRAITHAVVEGELMICSPDLPAMWGLVGTGVVLATKVASDIGDSVTEIGVPSGICVAWLNRVVIANGFALFFSDPVTAQGGSVRTFIPENQNARPAPIYGLHVTAGGALVVCTAAGVYALGPDAGAVAAVGSNGSDWQLLSHHRSISFESSALCRGRLYGLTREGIALIDSDRGEEIDLGDPVQPRYFGPRIDYPDFRAGRLFSAQRGPIAAIGDYVRMNDEVDSIASWWTSADSPTAFRLRGILTGHDGEEMLLTEQGVYRAVGNMDGGVLLSTEANSVTGVLAGTLPTVPRSNPTVRFIDAAAATAGDINIAVRGDAAGAEAPASESTGLIIATDSWGDAGKRAQTTPLRSVQADFNVNTDDIGIEVSVEGAGSRVSVMADVDVHGPGAESDTNRS